MPVTRISCSTLCSAKLGASLWMGSSALAPAGQHGVSMRCPGSARSHQTLARPRPAAALPCACQGAEWAPVPQWDGVQGSCPGGRVCCLVWAKMTPRQQAVAADVVCPARFQWGPGTCPHAPRCPQRPHPRRQRRAQLRWGAPMGPTSSTGSPITFMMRPSVSGPTGTCAAPARLAVRLRTGNTRAAHPCRQGQSSAGAGPQACAP